MCTQARIILLDALSDLNYTLIINDQLLAKAQIDIKAQTTSEQVRNDVSTHLLNSLEFIELITRTNTAISALNTNYVAAIISYSINFVAWYVLFTTWATTFNHQTTTCNCEQNSCSYPVGFYSFANNDDAYIYWYFNPQLYTATDVVPGFVGACTPLEALLQAKLVCLYLTECLAKLINYFPKLAQVRI